MISLIVNQYLLIEIRPRQVGAAIRRSFLVEPDEQKAHSNPRKNPNSRRVPHSQAQQKIEELKFSNFSPTNCQTGWPSLTLNLRKPYPQANV
jgi:hypothetical protein